MMRTTLDEAKEHWEAQWEERSFDPVTWIGERLSIKTFLKDDRDAKNLSLAWDALTLPYIKDKEQREIVTGIVRDAGRNYGRYVTLPPKGVKLLDAMAEAVNVSRPQGEINVDLFAKTQKHLK